MKKEKEKRNRSIFSRLVLSYVLFLATTIVVFIVVIIGALIYFGNGSVKNASPQNVIKTDGSINDIEALRRAGGWIEELDDDGRVINVIGEKKTDKNSYSVGEVANLVDIGYVDYNENGLKISTTDLRQKGSYSACARYAGNPEHAFLVFYPANMVSHSVSYMFINGSESAGNWIFMAFITIFLVEVIVISFYLKRHIDKPLKLLMRGMDEVSQGKRDVMLDYKTDREFENIRDRFNLMARKLKESEDEKYRVEQSKNTMLLELAHDIKNPIASIKGSICALEEGLVSEDKVSDYYKTIRLKAERIVNLTDDMNTSLKMESGDYKLNPEKEDLSELLRRICVESYEDITDNGRDFDIDIPDEPVNAMIDAPLFSRVINNLLANAGKYNKTGQNIGIRLSSEHSNIKIEVFDDGEVISKEFVPRLFEPFSRGDRTRKTDGGTGLGLAISRKIVEKHGGTLEYSYAMKRNVFTICLGQMSA